MRQTADIMEEARGFLRSRVILTAAELDLFTRLQDKPCTARNVAQAIGLDQRATTRILDCLVTFGLLEKQDGVYQTSNAGIILSSRHPQTILPMVLHLNHNWNSWTHLTEAVRRGVNPHRVPITERGAENQKAFIGAMHAAGRDLSNEIAAGYDLVCCQRLLDIGGGSGTYTIAFLRHNDKMTAVLFDLAGVIPMAAERLQQEGLAERVKLIPGNFYQDELPTGFDLALLSAIIHQNNPEENLELFRKAYRALEPDGILLIRDHIMDATRTEPPAGALFALNMLVNTSGGDTYTFEEVKDTLEKAGFVGVRWVRSGERMDSLVEAKKPV